MKRHTWNYPMGKGWWTLDQGKKAIDIGHTAAHYDHCSAPSCISLVNEHGDNNSKSQIEAEMLDVHCSYFVQFIYIHIYFKKISKKCFFIFLIEFSYTIPSNLIIVQNNNYYLILQEKSNLKEMCYQQQMSNNYTCKPYEGIT